MVVYASGPPGAERTDRDRGYPVVRDGSLLLPTPRVAARAVELLRRHRATRVIFGAAAPLGLLAPGLRAAGADRLVGLTHGHETWWATVPGGRRLLRRIGDACDHLTAVSAFTQTRIAAALSPAARSRLLRLPPPVDVHRFRPGSSSVPGDTPTRRPGSSAKIMTGRGRWRSAGSSRRRASPACCAPGQSSWIAGRVGPSAPNWSSSATGRNATGC